jgi:uncharacterized protein YjbJ (UPF0337 family)
MNEHTAAGKFDQIKGKVKQSVGEAVGNERMANSGAADQVKGAAKEGVGNVKDAFRDVRDGSARTRSEDTYATTDRNTAAPGHDVRQKVVSTAENVKDAIKNKTENIRRSA